MTYLIRWENYEVGSITKDINGWEIECTDEILINWNGAIFQEFEKERIFKQLEYEGFTVEQI